MQLCILGSPHSTVAVSWTTAVEHESSKEEGRGPLVATDFGKSPMVLLASPLIIFFRKSSTLPKEMTLVFT